MGNPLLKKFQIKDEYSVLLMNSNPSLHPLFDGVRIEYSDVTDEDFDSIILFTKNEQELRKWIPEAINKKTNGGQFWLSYPKKSGEIKTDLNRDITWKIIKTLGLEPIRLISMNEDWSSMRLIHGKDRKKASKLGEDPPGVDRVNKIVNPPNDLLQLFEINTKAKAFFDELSFSHKREYIRWIFDAKKDETRARRIQKIITLLNEKRKSR